MTKTGWSISDAAAALHERAVICNTTLKSIESLGAEHLEEALPRYTASGFTYVSLTVGLDETPLPIIEKELVGLVKGIAAGGIDLGIDMAVG